MARRYDENVFINCPFDEDYESLLHALVFTVHDCGFIARSALELDDSSEVRIDKIFRIISECRYGVYDLSRTELDPDSGLPRFNMPLELGLFLGAKKFGGEKQALKRCLILDREPYRYQRFCSDIAGQDLRAHGGVVRNAVVAVRNWLSSYAREMGSLVPSGAVIYRRYEAFLAQLPAWCEELGYEPEELVFNDRTTLVVQWLRENSFVPMRSIS
ncbi:MAG: hypothetical protein WBX15_04860 [Thermoanaerobaculia bacterium]